MSKLVYAGVSIALTVGLVMLSWSLLYQYSNVNGEVFRVNRVSGVRQKATAEGWRTEAEIAKEKVQAEIKASVEIDKAMEPGRVAARKALSMVSVDPKDDFYFLHTYNPSDYAFIPSNAYCVTVEYFSLDAKNNEHWLCTEKPGSGAMFSAKSHDSLILSDNYIGNAAPPEVLALPPRTTFIQRTTIEFESAQGGEDGLLLNNFVPPLKRTFDRTFQTK